MGSVQNAALNRNLLASNSANDQFSYTQADVQFGGLRRLATIGVTVLALAGCANKSDAEPTPVPAVWLTGV